MIRLVRPWFVAMTLRVGLFGGVAHSVRVDMRPLPQTVEETSDAEHEAEPSTSRASASKKKRRSVEKEEEEHASAGVSSKACFGLKLFFVASCLRATYTTHV